MKKNLILNNKLLFQLFKITASTKHLYVQNIFCPIQMLPKNYSDFLFSKQKLKNNFVNLSFIIPTSNIHLLICDYKVYLHTLKYKKNTPLNIWILYFSCQCLDIQLYLSSLYIRKRRVDEQYLNLNWPYFNATARA